MQTELFARNAARKEESTRKGRPLWWCVSAQQFCLQAETHIFCIVFQAINQEEYSRGIRHTHTDLQKTCVCNWLEPYC